jgi:hypothetical protein
MRLFIIHIILAMNIYIHSVLMLYHIAFYEVIHRPYILESYIMDIFVLSFYHPFISLHPLIFLFFFCFTTHNQIFYGKDFSCCNYMINPLISYSDCFLGFRQYEAISWLLNKLVISLFYLFIYSLFY